MYDLVRELNSSPVEERDSAEKLAAELKAMGAIFGVLQANPEEFLQAGGDEGLSGEEIDALIQQRHQAKLDKDYALADKIREDLKASGVILEDSRDGTSWRRE